MFGDVCFYVFQSPLLPIYQVYHVILFLCMLQVVSGLSNLSDYLLNLSVLLPNELGQFCKCSVCRYLV